MYPGRAPYGSRQRPGPLPAVQSQGEVNPEQSDWFYKDDAVMHKVDPLLAVGNGGKPRFMRHDPAGEHGAPRLSDRTKRFKALGTKRGPDHEDDDSDDARKENPAERDKDEEDVGKEELEEEKKRPDTLGGRIVTIAEGMRTRVDNVRLSLRDFALVLWYVMMSSLVQTFRPQTPQSLRFPFYGTDAGIQPERGAIQYHNGRAASRRSNPATALTTITEVDDETALYQPNTEEYDTQRFKTDLREAINNREWMSSDTNADSLLRQALEREDGLRIPRLRNHYGQGVTIPEMPATDIRKAMADVIDNFGDSKVSTLKLSVATYRAMYQHWHKHVHTQEKLKEYNISFRDYLRDATTTSRTMRRRKAKVKTYAATILFEVVKPYLAKNVDDAELKLFLETDDKTKALKHIKVTTRPYGFDTELNPTLYEKTKYFVNRNLDRILPDRLRSGVPDTHRRLPATYSDEARIAFDKAQAHNFEGRLKSLKPVIKGRVRQEDADTLNMIQDVAAQMSVKDREQFFDEKNEASIFRMFKDYKDGGDNKIIKYTAIMASLHGAKYQDSFFHNLYETKNMTPLLDSLNPSAFASKILETAQKKTGRLPVLNKGELRRAAFRLNLMFTETTKKMQALKSGAEDLTYTAALQINQDVIKMERDVTEFGKMGGLVTETPEKLRELGERYGRRIGSVEYDSPAGRAQVTKLNQLATANPQAEEEWVNATKFVKENDRTGQMGPLLQKALVEAPVGTLAEMVGEAREKGNRESLILLEAEGLDIFSLLPEEAMRVRNSHTAEHLVRLCDEFKQRQDVYERVVRKACEDYLVEISLRKRSEMELKRIMNETSQKTLNTYLGHNPPFLVKDQNDKVKWTSDGIAQVAEEIHNNTKGLNYHLLNQIQAECQKHESWQKYLFTRHRDKVMFLPAAAMSLLMFATTAGVPQVGAWLGSMALGLKVARQKWRKDAEFEKTAEDKLRKFLPKFYHNNQESIERLKRMSLYDDNMSWIKLAKLMLTKSGFDVGPVEKQNLTDDQLVKVLLELEDHNSGDKVSTKILKEQVARLLHRQALLQELAYYTVGDNKKLEGRDQTFMQKASGLITGVFSPKEDPEFVEEVDKFREAIRSRDQDIAAAGFSAIADKIFINSKQILDKNFDAGAKRRLQEAYKKDGTEATLVEHFIKNKLLATRSQCYLLYDFQMYQTALFTKIEKGEIKDREGKAEFRQAVYDQLLEKTAKDIMDKEHTEENIAAMKIDLKNFVEYLQHIFFDAEVNEPKKIAVELAAKKMDPINRQRIASLVAMRQHKS